MNASILVAAISVGIMVFARLVMGVLAFLSGRVPAVRIVLPMAFVFGPIRGIPFFWRLIDCGFGVLGILPLYLAWRYTRQIVEFCLPFSAPGT